LESLPYLWTKDGDNVVDNCTDATRNHYAIAAGIQGSTEAETEIQGLCSNDPKQISLSVYKSQEYTPITPFFKDVSGTAEANTCGGEKLVTSITTSYTSITAGAGNPLIWSNKSYRELNGISFTVLARIKDATTGYIRIYPNLIAGTFDVTGSSNASRPMATSTSYALYTTAIISSLTEDKLIPDVTFDYTLLLYALRNTGTNDITVDYFAVFPRPYCNYYFSSTIEKFYINGTTITVLSGTFTPPAVSIGKVVGDPIEFAPNKYNLLQTLTGGIGDDPTVAETTTYTIYVTPRYNLL
jgi:hypothetical protein